MSEGISNVNEAKAIVQSIDEAMFAEVTLSGGSKEKTLDLRQEIEMSKDQYKNAILELASVKTYFEELAEILEANEMPSANEKGAVLLSDSSLAQARTLLAKAEETLGVFDKAAELVKELHTLGRGLLTEVTALRGQIIIVTTRK